MRCPACRRSDLQTSFHRVEQVLKVILVVESCGSCGLSRQRQATDFEIVSMGASFYDRVGSAASMQYLAPDLPRCIWCGHPWSLHDGSCSGLHRRAFEDEPRHCGCTRRAFLPQSLVE